MIGLVDQQALPDPSAPIQNNTGIGDSRTAPTYDYNAAIKRRMEPIGQLGNDANVYAKQLADRRVEQSRIASNARIAQVAADNKRITADNYRKTAEAAQRNNQANVQKASTVSPSGAKFSPGVNNQMSIIDKMFPGVKATSGYRPGGASWHARGRAVDLPPTMAIYNWIKANYPDSRELIFGPGGNNQIKDGKVVPASFYGASTMSQHYNHIHWAY